MLPVQRQTEPANSPVIGNIQNASLEPVELDCPRVLPFIKPDEAALPAVEGCRDHVDVVVPESEHRLVRIKPAVGRQGVADLIKLRLGETDLTLSL